MKPMQERVANPGRRWAVLGLGAVVSLQAVAAPDGTRVLRAYLEPWPPYIYPAQDGKVRGLDAELLQAICDEAGFQLAWVRTPDARRRRRYQELLDDRYDVIFSATPVPRDLERVMYTRAYRLETMAVCAPAEHDPVLSDIQGFADLLDKRIRLLCADVGGLGKEFETYRARLDAARLLIPYPTTPLGIGMLRAGRGQLILGDARDLQEQARALNFPLVRQPYGFDTESVSLLLSRRRLGDADLKRIDQAIEELERRGVFEAIRDRYAMAPPDPARTGK